MLINQIKSDLLTARKARDSKKSALLSTLLSDIVNIGKNAGNRETTDAEAVSLIRKFMASVEQNFKLSQDINNLELMEQSKFELDILQAYMPKQLTEEELHVIISSIKNELGENVNMGLIMAKLKSTYPGQYDGSLASKITKGLL